MPRKSKNTDQEIAAEPEAVVEAPPEAQDGGSANPAGKERGQSDAASDTARAAHVANAQRDAERRTLREEQQHFAAGRAAALAKGGQEADRAIQEQRKLDAEAKQEAVRGREQLLAQAVAGPEDRTENVLVAKVSARAAAQEQERLDAGQKAAAAQQPEPPLPPPPTEGVLPPEPQSAHPPVPSVAGSAPHAETLPAGPMDDVVVYVTDDIAPDGTPLIRGEAQPFVEPSPQINGEDDKEYPNANNQLPFNPDETPVKINQHSEEGARLDELKTGVRTVFVPTETALDPKSGNNTY